MKSSTAPSEAPIATYTNPSNHHSVSHLSGAGTSATSNGTARVKEKQVDKLQQVKRRTIGAALIVDLCLVAALIYQLVSLNSSLTGFLRTKATNTLAFYDFQYDERYSFAEQGQIVYVNSSNTCSALMGADADAIADLQRRFKYDQIYRTNEIMALVNNQGVVVGSTGPDSARGQSFDADGLVSLYMAHYAESGKPLRASSMLDQRYYTMFQAPIYDAVGDVRPDLVSWDKQAQTLARITLTPVYCGQTIPQGFLLYVDSVTPRQYDYFGIMLFSAKSAMGGILALSPATGTWQTAFTYNQAGPYGAPTQFPDWTGDIFPDATDLHAVAESGSVVPGTFTYENVPYQYVMKAVPHITVGGVADKYDTTPDLVLYVYAEPQVPIRTTVHTAMSWQIPWIVILLLWSAISSRFVIVKFIHPMQKLIDSVKKKKMKEFNDHLRQIKSNRSALWQLLATMIITEAVLVGIFFANEALLDSVVPDFTSAATEGRTLAYVITSRSVNLLLYLAAWSTQTTLVTATANRTHTADLLTDTLRAQTAALHVDTICILGLNSEILASSYAPAVGHAFPEPGVIEHLRSQSIGSLQQPFTTHSAWTLNTVNITSDVTLKGPSGTPGLARLLVAPIRNVTYDSSTNTLVYGDLVGAVVIVRYINGADSIWIIDAFTPGYFGLHLWDRYNSRFVDMTSVLKQPDGLVWEYDITTENPSLLQSGLTAMYNDDRLSIQNQISVGGQPYTAAIVPFDRADEVVLSPAVVNAYVVRGLSESAWNRVRNEQRALVIVNMVLVVLVAVVKIVLAWLPLRRFLDALERAFTVNSMSAHRATKREAAAASLFDQNDYRGQQQTLSATIVPSQPHSSNSKQHQI